MVQVPVQDARRPQPGEFIQFEPERASRQPEELGVPNEGGKRASLQGDRKASPEVADVDSVAERVTDHRETGEAAFARFGLQDRAYAAHERLAKAISGSNSHSRMVRRSCTMSASTDIPERNP